MKRKKAPQAADLAADVAGAGDDEAKTTGQK
jgi:hypothetical protein